MSSRAVYKLLLVVLMGVGLGAGALTQKRLNALRSERGLTRQTQLENAPPMLTLTTVALGGFRGLIANYLWIRAQNHQLNGRYFEMMTLADWITKLQPSFGAVWAHQAWNMAYNISRQFSDPQDRWLWIRSGIELLRDRGLRYNPSSVEIYQELAFTFYHKIGSHYDDAHLYYKAQWATEMMTLLGLDANYRALLSPASDEARQTAQTLRSQYAMDPQRMSRIDETLGPLDWRLPEAHAIYWAALGIENASEDSELIPLRRIIWQSLLVGFEGGRLIDNPIDQNFSYGPNLNLADRIHDYLDDILSQENDRRFIIERAHQNFLANAVYSFYLDGQRDQAAHWFRILRARYPQAFGVDLGLNEFVVAYIEGNLRQANVNRVQNIIDGYLINSFFHLALGNDDLATGYNEFAKLVWTQYMRTIQERGGNEAVRAGLQPFQEIRQTVLRQILDEAGHPKFTPALQAQLKTVLGL